MKVKVKICTCSPYSIFLVGKDIDILKLREETMLYPDFIVYNNVQNVIKYVKEYNIYLRSR